MWQTLEQVAKNASGYVNSVQEKAQSLAIAVQDEASTLLHSAMRSIRTGPVDEILFEELADYKAFSTFFSIDEHKHEITRAMDENNDICELHHTLVPSKLSDEEFWRRYFFRQQQTQFLEQIDTLTPPEEKREDETRPEERQQSEQEGIWLLRAARDAERRAATQWRLKARELHSQLQEIKQIHDEKEQKALNEWEQQLQTLCDSYESKMAATLMQIDEARAQGYDEGVRESQAIVESIKHKTEKEVLQRRVDIVENGSNDAQVARLIKEKEELEMMVQSARERIAELEKHEGGLKTTAAVELTKEKDLWRMRALKMKKLKDLVQAELTSLRQQRDADAATQLANSDASASAQAGNIDDHSKLQARMNDLQMQLANALAGAEARAREAFEKGIEAGKAEMEQHMKQELDQAFHNGYKKAQAEAKSEMGVLRAELGMFRAFHESAAHCADDVGNDTENVLEDSIDDVLLADGLPLCSPTSSVSVFSDDSKNDAMLKATDDWGEW
ncbi:Uncharacterized conserved protein, contains BSD domain [Plasmopara halstedii]|uniref:Uncharacterized conserved protein, contains BSD domain n=1 Tax=Plasmopara halstedii TaxID=4781 RepID=A0A0P1AN96_PLAHL|nr:Uncharacterized conserved protein, contains BSD domain [Plasmopara halstedii]CEG42282.1 Uncharacterized conserved protein, contains BSD domain [Plasmopara halstedii]|eukprot:XP_024578651.1 Uncharacterized conserved protein, contains BSD domain [Plasmopara halstedii]